MEDTRTGTERTEMVRNQTVRLMGEAQDVVSGESDTLEGEDRTGITEGTEVHEGLVVPPPPPPIRIETMRRRSELWVRR